MIKTTAQQSHGISKTQPHDLFGTFYGDERGSSNLIEFWDHIPKYFVTEEQQAALRTAEGFLPILKRNFQVSKINWCLEIQPALLQIGDCQKSFYPGFSEEIIEDALRKLFSQRENGRFDHEKNKSWVRFSLKGISKELAKHSSSRSIDEIKRSLDIMAGCTIRLFRDGKEVHTTQIITSLTRVDRQEYLCDTDSRWTCRLPDLLSEAIIRGHYRQYNYALSMSLKTQLARWIHKRLSYNYTQAHSASFFNILLSTVSRDSGLLDKGDMKSRRRKMERALDELKERGVVNSYDAIPLKAGRKITDVKFNVFASESFVREMKAANKRKRDIQESIACEA